MPLIKWVDDGQTTKVLKQPWILGNIHTNFLHIPTMNALIDEDLTVSDLILENP